MSQLERTILNIEGMTCGHCKSAVEKALSAIAGVKEATVDLARKQATVLGSVDRNELINTVKDLGYEIKE